MNVGDVLACVFWLLLCLVVRHEMREQKRQDGRGWGGPGW